MISSIQNHAGRIVGGSENTRDPAELLQIEHAHARAASILEQSLNEIYLFDAETLHFEYVNSGAQRNLGYNMDKLRMMTPLDIKPEFDEASFRTMTDPLLYDMARRKCSFLKPCTSMPMARFIQSKFTRSYLRNRGARYFWQLFSISQPAGVPS